MKSASIRELKHATPAILQWVQLGHTVQITKHNRIVAVMTMPPAAVVENVERPDFAARLKKTWDGKKLKTTATELIHDERGDR
jgi:antitoxin (DNA-binding transcriptional repressor) of toxin-antitoxin stability system